MNRITSSPWGRPDSQREVAQGIIRVSTPDHGGYFVSAERFASMPEALRVSPDADGAWFEEDCLAHLVIAAFPEAFSDFLVWCTVKFLRSYPGLPAATAYLAEPVAKPLLDRHDRFDAENADKYVSGCQSSSPNGWNVSYRRIRDGAQAFASGLTLEEAMNDGPVDLTAFGARVTYANT